MKKKASVAVFVLVLLIALASPAFVAAKQDEGDKGLRGHIGQAGASKNAFIELWQKVDFDLPVEDGGWAIDPGGAWGKMRYNLTGTTFGFHFNGHGLEPGVSYSLIYYPDPWPGTGLIVFGSAVADDGGNILIKGSAEIETLPVEGDANEGAKIWLVLSNDVGEGQMAGWNPGQYLFEYDLITFNADIQATASSNAHPGKPDKSNNGKGHDE